MAKLIKGVNDLATMYPQLASEWDYDKNEGLTPSDVTAGSTRKVWWIGIKCGHRFHSKISDRRRGNGCSVCAGKQIMAGVNDLASQRPDLAEEWDYEQNDDLHPSNVAPNSNKKVWWKCKRCGYSYESVISSRYRGNGCPVCQNKRIIAGYNDLATINPELAAQWNYEKNDLKPTEVSVRSGKKVWWKCKSCGNEWQATISLRKNSGCPECAKKKPKKLAKTGLNDLATVRPDLLEEWCYERNGSLSPTRFTVGSNKKAWWKCKTCGYEWRATINARNAGSKCPRCVGNIVYTGVNDLETWGRKHDRIEILNDWDYEHNDALPSEVFAHEATVPRNWICPQGHTYQRTCAARIHIKGCPICNRAELRSGVNDLQTLYPELAEEWDYDKNDKLPTEVMPGSTTRVIWKCKSGHNWETSLLQRTRYLTGCPVCGKALHTSFAEQAIIYYLKQVIPDVINQDKQAIGKELDIFIPSMKTGIEYDGVRWHKSKSSLQKDERKNQLCADKRIRLIRVREEGLPVLDTCECVVRNAPDKIESLNAVIQTICTILSAEVDIDVLRDKAKIYFQYKNCFQNSLKECFPEIAAEWDYEKNSPITPDMVSKATKDKYYWVCKKCGYKWQCSVGSRTSQKTGCPKCGIERLKKSKGKRVLNIDTGVIFDSCVEAAKSCGGDERNISTVCRGKRDIAYGYHWKYVDE